MNIIAFALFSIALADEPAKPPAETQTAPAAETVQVEKPKDTSALVEAAKAAKAKRQQSGKKKVITNADVKKSTGKLLDYVPPDLPAGSEITVTPSTITEKHELQRKARVEAEARITGAEKKVKELEKELSGLELSFYEENDPNYRDNVIQQRFTQTKRQLEEARTELANARDALTAMDAQPKP